MNIIKAVEKYLKKIEKISNDNDSTIELSARPVLYNFLCELAEQIGNNLEVVHEAKANNFGRPDFLIKNSRGLQIGFIETKSKGEHRDKNSKQLNRYIDNLDNLILTDYVSFDLYQNGKLVRSCSLNRNKIESLAENILSLFKIFCGSFISNISTSKQLAIALARKATLIRGCFEEGFSLDQDDELNDTYLYYKKYLKPDSKYEEFIDNYVQCLVYGLFICKIEMSTSQVMNLPRFDGHQILW